MRMDRLSLRRFNDLPAVCGCLNPGGFDLRIDVKSPHRRCRAGFGFHACAYYAEISSSSAETRVLDVDVLPCEL